MDLALGYTADYLGATSPPKTIHLLTDCQAALTAVTSPLLSMSRSHGQLIHDINIKVKDLNAKGHKTSITWIAGHAGLAGNDLADKLAKTAANEASAGRTDGEMCSKTMEEIKAEIRRQSVQRWDKAWSSCDKGRFLYDLQPFVALKPRIIRSNRGYASKYLRLCTGHTCLNEHMHRMGIPGHDSPVCECGQDIGNVPHFLLHCSRQSTQRETLFDAIDFYRNNVQPYNRFIDLHTLLGPGTSFTRETKEAIQEAVIRFIMDSHIGL